MPLFRSGPLSLPRYDDTTDAPSWNNWLAAAFASMRTRSLMMELARSVKLSLPVVAKVVRLSSMPLKALLKRPSVCVATSAALDA